MKSRVFAILMLGFVILAVSCVQQSPEAIRYGEDQCAHCRMTVSDMRFGTQIFTKKGRTYHFDDLKCMVGFVQSGNISQEQVAGYYLPDYSNENKLFPAETMFLLKSESLKSPMRGDIAAFASQTDMENALEHHDGEVLLWADLWK